MVEKRFDRRRSFLENANRSSFFQQEERKDRGAGDSGRKVERDAAGYRDGMTINDSSEDEEGSRQSAGNYDAPLLRPQTGPWVQVVATR